MNSAIPINISIAFILIPPYILLIKLYMPTVVPIKVIHDIKAPPPNKQDLSNLYKTVIPADNIANIIHIIIR